jgi:putative ABC transport system permease protein
VAGSASPSATSAATLRRFTILLACLALGVGTITIVGSVSAALQASLVRDARVLLGGDLDATLSYRAINADEKALLQSLGTLSEQVEVLGRAASETQSTFISIRAVDANYPLVGTATVADSAATVAELTARDGDNFGLVADSLLLDRLQVGLGDTITIENATFTVRGVIEALPDQLTNGIGIGVPVVMSVEAVNATGIIEPGVLARFHNKLLLNPGVTFEAASEQIRTAFPSASFQVNAPKDATADLARFFDIFGRFLIIVGLSSLLIGGVGVSNAIAAYVTERQRSIATMKALGATGAQIMAHFLFQVMLLTGVGIVLGLMLGSLLTLVALPILGGLLGLDLPAVLDPGTLATAAGFGLLVGFAFGYLPLRRGAEAEACLAVPLGRLCRGRRPRLARLFPPRPMAAAQPRRPRHFRPRHPEHRTGRCWCSGMRARCSARSSCCASPRGCCRPSFALCRRCPTRRFAMR